ncbi:hypothetical protein [Variovorax sp. CCNWLW235]|uniref:hypothetical protein n=1 Tax=Variovorax sp. CCNWLW235 TaxID=3127463 RepID=UPI003077C68C
MKPSAFALDEEGAPKKSYTPLLPVSFPQEANMDWDFFRAALAGGGVTAVLLSIAGVLGRSQLSHWLNKDIERIKAQFQRDIQIDKAAFERELEAYKVSLIAEAERAKAIQSIKTAGALRMIDRKYEVLNEVCKAVREYASTGVAFCTLVFASGDAFVRRQSWVSEYLQAGGDAIEAVAPFITHDEYGQLLDLHVKVTAAINDRNSFDVALPQPRLDAFRAEIVQLQADVNNLLQDKITAMMEMA